MPHSLLRLLGLGPPARAPATPPRRRRRASRPRDFQRARVYEWEREHVFPHAGDRLSLDACRALVEAAFRWHEAPSPLDRRWSPPEVTDGRGRRHACGSRDFIKLPRWARTRAIVLHECAHGMARDGHGPEFVAAYVRLLAQFSTIDVATLIGSLSAAGIAHAGFEAGMGRP